MKGHPLFLPPEQASVSPRQIWAANRFWMETENLKSRRHGGQSRHRWYTLLFEWDVSLRTCVVSVDGEPKVYLKPSYTPTHGISYVRLRSTAERVDPAGFLVESVKVDVSGSGPSSRP